MKNQKDGFTYYEIENFQYNVDEVNNDQKQQVLDEELQAMQVIMFRHENCNQKIYYNLVAILKQRGIDMNDDYGEQNIKMTCPNCGQNLQDKHIVDYIVYTDSDFNADLNKNVSQYQWNRFIYYEKAKLFFLPTVLKRQDFEKKSNLAVLFKLVIESCRREDPHNSIQWLENNVFHSFGRDESNLVIQWIFTSLCAITKRKITTPVRFSNCNHLECFDLESVLQLIDINTNSITLKCPVNKCSGNLHLEQDTIKQNIGKSFKFDTFLFEHIQAKPLTEIQFVFNKSKSNETVLCENLFLMQSDGLTADEQAIKDFNLFVIEKSFRESMSNFCDQREELLESQFEDGEDYGGLIKGEIDLLNIDPKIPIFCQQCKTMVPGCLRDIFLKQPIKIKNQKGFYCPSEKHFKLSIEDFLETVFIDPFVMFGIYNQSQDQAKVQVLDDFSEVIKEKKESEFPAMSLQHQSQLGFDSQEYLNIEEHPSPLDQSQTIKIGVPIKYVKCLYYECVIDQDHLSEYLYNSPPIDCAKCPETIYFDQKQNFQKLVNLEKEIKKGIKIFQPSEDDDENVGSVAQSSFGMNKPPNRSIILKKTMDRSISETVNRDDPYSDEEEEKGLIDCLYGTKITSDCKPYFANQTCQQRCIFDQNKFDKDPEAEKGKLCLFCKMKIQQTDSMICVPKALKNSSKPLNKVIPQYQFIPSVYSFSQVAKPYPEQYADPLLSFLQK